MRLSCQTCQLGDLFSKNWSLYSGIESVLGIFWSLITLQDWRCADSANGNIEKVRVLVGETNLGVKMPQSCFVMSLENTIARGFWRTTMECAMTQGPELQTCLVINYVFNLWVAIIERKHWWSSKVLHRGNVHINPSFHNYDRYYCDAKQVPWASRQSFLCPSPEGTPSQCLVRQVPIFANPAQPKV